MHTTQFQPAAALCPWQAALYIRLSRDDGDKAESDSVTYQREILREHLRLHPDISLHGIYIDDGWSGTNFNRPDFQRMMEDIYAGKVNCVIVKDLSRFCRNASEGGQYLDNIFVRHRVRFIAVNNGIDTASNTMNAATQLISVGVTALVSGLTIGGKAMSKTFAMKQSTRVVYLAGRFLHLFHR